MPVGEHRLSDTRVCLFYGLNCWIKQVLKNKEHTKNWLLYGSFMHEMMQILLGLYAGLQCWTVKRVITLNIIFNQTMLSTGAKNCSQLVSIIVNFLRYPCVYCYNALHWLSTENKSHLSIEVRCFCVRQPTISTWHKAWLCFIFFKWN